VTSFIVLTNEISVLANAGSFFCSTSARYISSDVSGTVPANLNAELVLFVGSETPSMLYYQCEAHVAMGGRILVFGTNSSNSSTFSSSPNAGVIAHAVLMSVAFCLLIPLGVITSSFLPYKVIALFFFFQIVTF
jgi:hypothetical protein